MGHRERIRKVRARSVIPGRQRWDIGVMLNQPSVAELLEAELRESPGVTVVRANPVTGRLLVHHDTALNGAKIGQLVQEAVRQVMVFTRSLRATPDAALVRARRHQHAVENFDPLLGRTRQAQLAEIGSGGAIVIVDDERKLNRYIAAAAVSMGTAIMSFAYPPLFPLVVASRSTPACGSLGMATTPSSANASFAWT